MPPPRMSTGQKQDYQKRGTEQQENPADRRDLRFIIRQEIAQVMKQLRRDIMPRNESEKQPIEGERGSTLNGISMTNDPKGAQKNIPVGQGPERRSTVLDRKASKEARRREAVKGA